MTEQNTLDTVNDEIDLRFTSIKDDDWMVLINGSYCNEKNAKAMISYAIYFNQSFTIQMYRMLLGLVTPHHNIEITKDWLIRLGIVEKSEENMTT